MSPPRDGDRDPRVDAAIAFEAERWQQTPPSNDTDAVDFAQVEGAEPADEPSQGAQETPAADSGDASSPPASSESRDESPDSAESVNAETEVVTDHTSPPGSDEPEPTAEPTPPPSAAAKPPAGASHGAQASQAQLFAPPPMTERFLRELREMAITDRTIEHWKLGVETDLPTIAERLNRKPKQLATRVRGPDKLGWPPGRPPACGGLQYPSWLPSQSHDDWPHAFRYKLEWPTPSWKKDKATGKWEAERRADGSYEVAKYIAASRRPPIVYFGASLDCGRSVLELLGDPAVPVLWLEGDKKLLVMLQVADLAIGLTGIYNFGDKKKRDAWKEKHPKSKKHAPFFWHPDILPHVPSFRAHKHVIVYDHYADKSDPAEPEAANELATLLYEADASEVRFVVPPTKETKGVDDFYAHHARRDGAAPDLGIDAEVAFDLEAGKRAVIELLEQAELIPREQQKTRRSKHDAGASQKSNGAAARAAVQDDDADEDDAGLPTLGLDPLPKAVEPLTGLAQAHRLARADFFGGDLRHDSAHGWMAWDGGVWRRDEAAAMRCAMDTSRAVVLHASRWIRDTKKKLTAAREVANKELEEELEAELEEANELFAWAHRQQERNALSNVLELASKIDPIVTKPETWDRDLLALNCKNGTIDLRTGELRPHRREDMLTKCIELDYDPHASAPLFEEFLAEVQPSAEVRAYLLRVAGYAAVGVVREHVLVVFWGTGSNGKSVFAGAIADTLGPYARTGADSLITRTGDHEPHPADIAACLGARLVLVHETRQGAAFDASKIKKLTGGDELTARHMRQDFFDFKPTHTLVMLTNYKPHGDASDAALWRRIHLVPWDVTIPPDRVDKTLPERLRAEAQGILASIVRGAVEWHREGLAPPKKILDQTAAYQKAEDVIGQFIREECVVVEKASCRAGQIYAAYRRWCEANGHRPKSSKDFSPQLQRRGYERTEDRTGNWYHGIGLAEPPATPSAEPPTDREL